MKTKWGYTLFSFLSLIGIWQITYISGVVNPIFLPAPIEVLRSMGAILLDAEYRFDLWMTLGRVVLSFLIAMVAGTVIGLLMGINHYVYAVSDWFVDFFRGLPVTALLPLFVLLFGVGSVAKVAVAIWGATFVIIVASFEGVRSANILRQKVVKTFGVSSWVNFSRITIFEALPEMMIGYRLALGLCLVLIIVAEMMIGSEFGLGSRIIEAQLNYQSSLLYAVIICTGVMGYVLNKIFLVLENTGIHWRGN